MSEEEAPAAQYRDGEIVWVKLGPSWWPGEVKDIGSLPEDVATFKKPPLVVVKFFEEDLYEYVRSWSNIYPYNCEKKTEFIRKGLAAYRANAPHMEKFPKDVTTAEVKIDGNPNILSDPECLPKKKNLNDPKMKKAKDKLKNKSPTKDTSHITHRRFLGVDSLNDYRAYICIQYPGKDRTPGDAEDDEVIRINTESEREYKCYTCTFTTKRLEVMIMHRKSHIQGVYVSTTPRKYKSSPVKRQKKDRPKVKGPEAKKKKVHTPEKSGETSRSLAPSEVTKPTQSKEITSKLLAEWDDDDEEGKNSDESIQHEIVKPYLPCEAAKNDENSSEAVQACGSGIISPANYKEGQKENEVAEHSKMDVEAEQDVAKEGVQKTVDHENTDTDEHKQKEQTKDSESTAVEPISSETKESKAPEKKPVRFSRWDSRIIQKRESEGSKQSENLKEDFINVGNKQFETSSKGEQKSSEEESHNTTKKDSHKVTTYFSKSTRENDSKSPEVKKSSSFQKEPSESSERELGRSDEETRNISAIDSKRDKSASKKRSNSTAKESITKDSKTLNDDDTKMSATDTKAFSKEYSKTSEKKDSKCNVRESRNSRRSESRSTVEKGSATDSKTLWKKDKISENKESRSSEGGSKIIRSTGNTEEKEARSYGVDSKSRWRRKTPEKASKTTLQNDDKDSENSDSNPKTLWKLDSVNTDSSSFEVESNTPSKIESKSFDESSYKSLWKRDSRNLEKKESKGNKAFESHETKYPESQVDKDIKSCFDFDEEEEEEPVISAAPAGRKIPRVIPERRKSTTVEPVEDIPNTSDVLKGSHSMELNIEAPENVADDNLENTFKELMETTKVPNLPDIKNTLKCEQNFHNIKTIKFPDKALGEPSPLKEEVATKLTNPKKRFVKSFEDFEMMQNNIKKKEEGVDLQQKEDEPENEINESLNETIHAKVNQPQKKEKKVFSPEKYYDMETFKETDVQRVAQEEISHHIESPVQLNEENIQQLDKQMIKPVSNLMEKQHVEENIIMETIQEKFVDMESSEKKLEANEKTAPPQQHSDDNNDESKVGKLVMEKFHIVKPKAKLIAPFKIQRETNKQHSTLPKPISMKDVIANMTNETEPPAELETKAHFANLKSKIMFKIIGDSKLSNASKDKIMSLMESEKDSETEHLDEVEATRTKSSKHCHKTPRTKILESYMEDQKPSHTSDAVFEQHSSVGSMEESITLPEEAIAIAQKRITVLEKKVPVNQEKRGRWSRRGSHPKKDRTFMEKTESLLEESHIPLPQEAPRFLPEEPSVSEPEELPLSDQSAVALPEEPPKPNIADVSKDIVLDEIPLPEEIAVEDIPLPPEPLAPEQVPLDNIPLSSTEEIEKSGQPLLSSTKPETRIFPAVQLNKIEELEVMDSKDNTKPLTIHLDNDHSESIFTSQSFLSSSMDFSPIGTASASLPDNAICLPPKKSKKRKYPCTDDETDSGSSKKISTDSQPLLDNQINWSTMNKADCVANDSKQESINCSLAVDVEWTASKEGVVAQSQASPNNEANSKVCSQSPGEGESRCNTEKETENSHSLVEYTSEQLTTDLHSFANDDVNWNSTQKIDVENAERWENEQQSVTRHEQHAFKNENEQSFQEAEKEDDQNLMIEKLVENDESVVEEGMTQQGIQNITVADKTELSEQAGKTTEECVVAEIDDKLKSEIGGEISSLMKVEEENKMPVIDAINNVESVGPIDVGRDIEQEKDLEEICERDISMIIEEENHQEEFDDNVKEITIGDEERALSPNRKDKEEMRNATIVDQSEKVEQDNNVKTQSNEQDLQSNLLRKNTLERSTVEESFAEEKSAVRDVPGELVVEEIGKDRTIDLAMEGTELLVKHNERQELDHAPLESIISEKSTPINQTSPVIKTNENVAAGLSNDVEMQCTSNSDDDIKFAIQTNLSNISSQQEVSTIALATLAAVRTDPENSDSNISTETLLSKSQETTDINPNVIKNRGVSFAIDPSISKSNDSADIGLEKVHQVPELVHIEGNLTVMSEKDLADAQVEITPEQVISTKKSAMLSNFSIDFSDSTNDSCNTNEPNDFDSKGTEFSSNAMTKELKRKSTNRGNTYGRLELLNILEGNSDNEKKDKQNLTVTDDDMCDFEDHIPSQIVCAKMLTDDMLNDDAPKTSISVTTHKLLERLSESKTKLPTKSELKAKTLPILSKGKSTFKAKSNVLGKPVTLPEQVVKTAAEYTTEDLDDIEDVKAFVIHKDLKKLKAEEPETKPVPEKPAGRASNKRSVAAKAAKAKLAAGKAKILQQTIITPAGEIIQPKVTSHPSSMTQQKAGPTIVVSQPKHPSQTVVTSQAKTVVQPDVKPAAGPVTQQDDNVFDINSMPIVLSDELLTPESIEKMPIMIGTEAATGSKPMTQDKLFITTSSSRRPIVRKIIGKIATTTTPPNINQPTATATKTAVKPRILSGSPSRALKQVTSTMANLAKPGKYIIVPQGSTVSSAAKYVDKKLPLNKNTTAAIPTTLSPEPTGNKIMIVTNHEGHQQRLLLTPAQQKLLGCQTPTAKLTKSIAKGNVLQKSVPAAIGSPTSGTTEILKNQSATIGAQKIVIGPNVTGNVTTPTQKLSVVTQAKSKGGAKRIQQINQKLHSPISKSQKTIFIKTPQGQTIRKMQGTDTELEKQVAEQLEAIRASSGKFTTQQQVAKTPDPKISAQKPSRRSNPRIPDSKTKGLVSQLTKHETGVASPSAIQLAKKEVGSAANRETKEAQNQPSRPLNQLVIQDAMGNQTTITEGQILALPSETVDGQPQSYMLVTLDESGNLTPLNNEALMSLDPNLGLAGDLSNMVLQIDQGGMQTGTGSIVEQKLPLTQQAVVKSQLPHDAKPELPPAPEAELMSEVKAKSEIVEPIVAQKAVIAQTSVEGIATTSATEPSSQQLIVTGDPIATQKFLESLSEGTTDLANILANADGNSILIQADGQQILINTNADNQMMFGVGDSTEGGGRNPIFSTQPSKNQDILAAALADTDVFQSEQHTQGKIGSELSPNNTLYPMNVGNVLETSLTLSSPIMTPLEVPSTNNKKIPDDEADILTRLPKNVDLPITITDPNISQTVANQQVASLIANELQSNLDLGLPIPEASIATVSNEINSPSYSYSSPALEDSVDISTHKPFGSSMPLLNEDVDETTETQNDKEDTKVEDKTEVKADNTDSMDSKKQEDSINSDGSFLEEEGRFTLGGEMCSSLSEPPPEMFDIPESPRDSDLMDMSHPDSSNDGSCEIPLQPMIIAKSTELGSHFGSLKKNSDDRDRGTGKRNEYD
nr:unnamed protein product [Callosobruchus chinensis]